MTKVKASPFRAGGVKYFIKSNLIRMFSNPVISGVTTKTPRLTLAQQRQGGGHIFNPVLPKLTYSIPEVS